MVYIPPSVISSLTSYPHDCFSLRPNSKYSSLSATRRGSALPFRRQGPADTGCRLNVTPANTTSTTTTDANGTDTRPTTSIMITRGCNQTVEQLWAHAVLNPIPELCRALHWEKSLVCLLLCVRPITLTTGFGAPCAVCIHNKTGNTRFMLLAHWLLARDQVRLGRKPVFTLHGLRSRTLIGTPPHVRSRLLLASEWPFAAVDAGLEVWSELR